MGNFEFNETLIKGVYIIQPKFFEDNRGYFMETYNQADFYEAGLNMVFLKDNESKSSKGVLRGLHFQKRHSQGKLVRVIKGEVFDVAVDLRVGSPTYGQWCGVVLNENNRKQFYIPEGFAHGFLVLSDEAIFNYKCTDIYDPKYEDGVMWNDKQIDIKWPIEQVGKVILSEKDKNHKSLDQVDLSKYPHFVFN